MSGHWMRDPEGRKKERKEEVQTRAKPDTASRKEFETNLHPEIPSNEPVT